MRDYNSIEIGEKATIQHEITEKDLKQFVNLTGDDNKLHVDSQFSKKTSFKKPVVHGMLGASFISTVIGTKLPGDGALWYSQSLDFLLPIRVGDKLIIEATVKEKIDRDKSIVLITEVFNHKKQKVIKGTAKVKLIQKVIKSTNESYKERKKVALIVGSTGGIGQATCLQLAKDGFDIALHYFKNKNIANNLKSKIEGLGINADIFNCDINDNSEVVRMVEKIDRKFGGLTVLVNCASASVPNIKFSINEWEDMKLQLDMHLKGFYNLIKAVIPIFHINKYGKIIGLITQYIEDPQPELSHYITAKAAQLGLLKSLAVELAPKGIRINLVSPGMTDTDLIADVPEKIKQVTAAKAPLRRLANPEDVAGAVSYLSSKKSDYLAGETIRINGGQVML